MKPEQFSELCRRGALYVFPATVGIVTVRGGVESNGAHWILCVDSKGFHLLPTANLKERQIPGGVTWEDDNGVPAFTLMDQVLCEEVNPDDAESARAALFAEVTTPSGSIWYQQQIAGAADAGPEQMAWIRPRTAYDGPP